MSDQTVIVTGAGSGIGRAIALAFAQRQACVVLAGRTAVSLEETAEQLSATGAECLVQPADVADARSVDKLIAAAVDRFGRIDVLVNNAGMGTRAKLSDLSVDDFDRMCAVNVNGVFYTCKAVWPVMQQQDGGVIINISSMAAFDPFPGLVPYGGTKAFVNLLTKGLAEEGRKRNIAVFAVAPGAVDTDMLRTAFPDFPSAEMLPPSAIADVVVNLTDPTMRHCAGQTIPVCK